MKISANQWFRPSWTKNWPISYGLVYGFEPKPWSSINQIVDNGLVMGQFMIWTSLCMHVLAHFLFFFLENNLLGSYIFYSKKIHIFIDSENCRYRTRATLYELCFGLSYVSLSIQVLLKWWLLRDGPKAHDPSKKAQKQKHHNRLFFH